MHMSPTRLLRNGKPVVDRRLDDSTILYRYMDTPKFMDFLHNSRIYFPRGDQFQDKFEGQFTTSLKQSIEQSYKENKINFTYEKFRMTLRKRVFISCWHQSDTESMAMWSVYGRSSCSVAITTTVGLLKKAIKALNLPYLVSIEKVDYVDYQSDPDLDISPYARVFAYKHDAYSFENEVRVLLDRSVNEFDVPIEDKGIPLQFAHKDILRSVVVAPEAPGWFVSLITDIARNKYKIGVPCCPSALSIQPI